ncbi:MAG: hypothetical protein R3325_00325 [Thermoanaerobaculia bacterium]|nr:hypothetical protein [Thermoanaerobaculia bacterium]
MVSAELERFVILAAPRSGSNMLCTMLDSHPAILCHHEIFNPKGVWVALDLRQSGFRLGSVEEREADPLAFLDRLWEHPFGRPCVGFKFTHRQNEAVFPRLLRDAGLKKIVLRRRNRLKTFVSSLISERLGQWEAYSEKELAAERPRVAVDPARFRDHVDFDRAYYREIRSSLEADGQSWAEASYEELGELSVQNRLLRFLGQTPVAEPLEPRSVKQNSRDLRDLIANYDELARALAGTEFEGEMTSLDD